MAARRHTRFVPGGLKYQPVRDVPLKDEFDEWLARVVCFAFSVPPTAFAKGTNRATAETAQGTAMAEGLRPLLGWVKGLIDRILAQVLGWPDLEFAWADQAATDPQAQATIAAAYVAAGIKTRNEVRAELGLDPVPGGDTLTTATPAAPLPEASSSDTVAKAGFDPGQPRDEGGRWSREGTASIATPRTGPRVISDIPPEGFVPGDQIAMAEPEAGGPEPEPGAERSGEERIETFDAMPPYLQQSILTVRDPALRGRLMGDQELAETRYQYNRVTEALRRVDPNNPLLSTVHSDDWLPSETDVADLQNAAHSASTSGPRPDWLQSEWDNLKDGGPSRRPQISFKDQQEVPYGTPGSVRPDSVEDGVAAFEVKNYNIEMNVNALIRHFPDDRPISAPSGDDKPSIRGPRSRI